jgi:hypothetical protein
MRKLPAVPALLAAALLVALPALADEAAPSGDGEAAEPTGDAPAEKKKAEKAGEEKSDDDSGGMNNAAAMGNPALAAAGGDRPVPIWVSASMTNTVGSGTFVFGYADDPLISSNLSLSPLLMLGDWQIGANQSLDFEWTQSNSTTTANQLMWSDTSLSARYLGLRIPAANLGFVFSGGALLPISLASQFAGRITTLSGGARIMWNLPSAGIFTGLGVNGAYNIAVPALANRAVDVSRLWGGYQPIGCITRSADELGNYACGSIPRAGRYGANASFTWMTLGGQLFLSASASFTHSIGGYLGPDDEFTSPYAQTGVQMGMPLTSGSLSATYMPTPWFSMTGGTWTMQPILSSDQKGVRPFPFWDLATSGPITTPANNFSTVFLTTTFTL